MAKYAAMLSTNSVDERWEKALRAFVGAGGRFREPGNPKGIKGFQETLAYDLGEFLSTDIFHITDPEVIKTNRVSKDTIDNIWKLVLLVILSNTHENAVSNLMPVTGNGTGGAELSNAESLRDAVNDIKEMIMVCRSGVIKTVINTEEGYKNIL